MKVRDSGMPERDMWETFFNPAEILAMLGLNSQTVDVAEFGCGYGTFTIPAAKVIKGEIYALDIEPDMIRITDEEAKKNGLNDVQTVLRDFIADGSGLLDGSVDYAMLFNILHLEKPMILINEAKRILRGGGKLGIIHWNYDSMTPRGPSMDIRPKPEDCLKWAESAGFSGAIQFDLKPYHYGIVLIKKEI
ncbi:MAG: Methyltransferase type 11 [Candidatus Uhrbacteria bacterium GW2011_GWF2_41_16]|uniref:Methyltransferase type 11 n=1 Tax=Candidatus Uhrbacteria bacterium GW2011_GWF2_41_16 TaxID=1618997 RepID=A0A0G0Y8A6_9BACT|nr:MAG: Methyltransferase type 11 [Candidatus Uhrbacteria bacterium GW2011_GWF2_41_16]